MLICYLGSGYRDLGQVNQSYNLFSVKNYNLLKIFLPHLSVQLHIKDDGCKKEGETCRDDCVILGPVGCSTRTYCCEEGLICRSGDDRCRRQGTTFRNTDNNQFILHVSVETESILFTRP